MDFVEISEAFYSCEIVALCLTVEGQILNGRSRLTIERIWILIVLLLFQCFNSLGCINECLAFDSGGYVNE